MTSWSVLPWWNVAGPELAKTSAVHRFESWKVAKTARGSFSLRHVGCPVKDPGAARDSASAEGKFNACCAAKAHNCNHYGAKQKGRTGTRTVRLEPFIPCVWTLSFQSPPLARTPAKSMQRSRPQRGPPQAASKPLYSSTGWIPGTFAFVGTKRQELQRLVAAAGRQPADNGLLEALWLQRLWKIPMWA